MTRSVVFSSPWCRLLAEPLPDGESYYMLDVPDYVTVLARTDTGGILLVRQHRPVVGRETLELPAGHVDGGESSEEAARRELLEETGMVARQIEFLGVLDPDVGRLTNRMWCYFADGVMPAAVPPPREEGITVVELPESEALAMALDGRMAHALNLAVLFLAIGKKKLALGRT